jgi:hypothetical protein
MLASAPRRIEAQLGQVMGCVLTVLRIRAAFEKAEFNSPKTSLAGLASDY